MSNILLNSVIFSVTSKTKIRVFCKNYAYCKSFRHLRRFNSNYPYSDTLKLPKTDFINYIKNPKEHEAEIRKICRFDDLYQCQRKFNDKKHEFVLHDGPPYANGDPHVGHLVNKVLKDITCRYKLLEGRKIHYKPGWDCHGLPIELLALKSYQFPDDFRTPENTRILAKNCALQAIQKQTDAFKSWGVMADWDTGTYNTMTREYEASELQAFYDLYCRGFIYRSYKPVYWSPSSETCLGESELIYNDSHKSASVWFKFELKNIPSHIKSQLPKPETPLYALLWTTQPWTIVVNEAIAFNPDMIYSITKNESSGDHFLLANECTPNAARAGPRFHNIVNIPGGDLAGTSYVHPLYPNESKPIVPAHFVTTLKGSGLVHIAPAHGMDDFNVAIDNGLSVECNVDKKARFTDNMGYGLKGMFVHEEGNRRVIDCLQSAGSIVAVEEITHSYPYDWRSNQPVVIIPLKQWFVDCGKLRDKAMEALNGVKGVPGHVISSLAASLTKRSYWCISRQRSWGIPIPVYYHKETGEEILEPETFLHIKSKVEQFGSDYWFRDDAKLPTDILNQLGLAAEDVVQGEDILDIWFDSGISWNNVLSDTGHPSGNGGRGFFSKWFNRDSATVKQADLYLEGQDQYGGWLQSSLLLSAALQGKASYKEVIIHGFTVDENRKKMSKSIGNVVDPQKLVEDGIPVDALRLWVVSTPFDVDKRIGKKILWECKDQYNKFRNTFRFILGALSDYRHSRDEVNYDDLRQLDRYMLHYLRVMHDKVSIAYSDYNYNGVYNAVVEFIHAKLSGMYIDCNRHCLYCKPQNDHSRRCVQTVIYQCLVLLNRTIAPITPHLSEEVFYYLKPISDHRDPNTVHRFDLETNEVPKFSQELVDFFEYRYKPKRLSDDDWDHFPGINFPFADKIVPDNEALDDVEAFIRTEHKVPIYDPKLRELEKQYIQWKMENRTTRKVFCEYAGLFGETLPNMSDNWRLYESDIPKLKLAFELHKVGLTLCHTNQAKQFDVVIHSEPGWAYETIQELISQGVLSSLMRGCSVNLTTEMVLLEGKSRGSQTRLFIYVNKDYFCKDKVYVLYRESTGHKCPRCFFRVSEEENTLCGDCAECVYTI